MPLRDHFRPPVWKQASWEGIHAMLTGMITYDLSKILPDDYAVEPRVELGPYFEMDEAGAETVALPHIIDSELENVAEYAYEVLIFDRSSNNKLVAAVELVSPGNKHRPEARQAFVSKCSALLQNCVCVSVVDLVTTRSFNLFGELMDCLGSSKSPFTKTSPATYAVTCRGRKVHDRPRFEVWAYPLIVGQSLPTLPIWLTEDLSVSLELEATYEDTCRTLRIR